MAPKITASTKTDETRDHYGLHYPVVKIDGVEAVSNTGWSDKRTAERKAEEMKEEVENELLGIA